MGDQADDGEGLPLLRCRQGGEHIAVLVEVGVLEAGLHQLSHEHPAQLELTRGAGTRVPVSAGLRVDPHISQEPIEDIGGQPLREF